MENPTRPRTGGQAGLTVTMKPGAYSLLIGFPFCLHFSPGEHCSCVLLPPKGNAWFGSLKPVLSVLRAHLLFLFWILKWDDVRRWRPTTPFLLDPDKVSWKPLYSEAANSCQQKSEKRAWEAQGSVSVPRSPVKDTSVLHSQRCCHCSPARVTHCTPSFPSHPSKRLFPRGLISRFRLLLCCFLISIIFREERAYCIIAWLWNFISISLHLQLQYEREKARA